MTLRTVEHASPKTRTRLTPVEETMLIPLYGRAQACRYTPPLLNDPKAEELVQGIDYDFSRLARNVVPVVTTLRTLIIDRWLIRHLGSHDVGTVAEIGVGLNTRFHRIANPSLRWLELDLPDALALRRQLIGESEGRTMVAGSLLDPGWMDAARACPGPYVFIVEAVLYYLPKHEALRVLRDIVRAFPGSYLCLDTASAATVERSNRAGGVLRDTGAKLLWSCTGPEELASWVPGLELVESHRVGDVCAEDLRSLPLRWRLVFTLGRRLAPKVFDSLRIGVFRVPAA